MFQPSGANGVDIVDLAKSFGPARVLDGISLAMAPGEFVALLGPSGCGKTTLLRSVAGLLAPDSGTIRLGADTVVDAARDLFVPAEKRHLGMVFQDYGLWPHLRVKDNVGFPLAARGRPKADHAALIEAALQRVALGHLAERFPGELSGGQQQRVAVARAIVDAPRILLFDEPLSNLDAGLRDTLGREIATLVRSLRTTALYVTHDQTEALSLADRIAVMRDGRIVQLDTPERLYQEPADAGVAAFLKAGSLIEGLVADGRFSPHGMAESIAVISPITGPATLLVPAAALRPGTGGTVRLRVETAQFRGDRYEITARWGAHDTAPRLHFWFPHRLQPGQEIPVAVDAAQLRLFSVSA